MKDSRELSKLFLHFLEQLIIRHEADDPQSIYQRCADLCQNKANRLAALDPARNK